MLYLTAPRQSDFGKASMATRSLRSVIAEVLEIDPARWTTALV